MYVRTLSEINRDGDSVRLVPASKTCIDQLDTARPIAEPGRRLAGISNIDGTKCPSIAYLIRMDSVPIFRETPSMLASGLSSKNVFSFTLSGSIFTR